MNQPTPSFRFRLPAALLAIALLALTAAPVLADDRDLLREQAGEPLVFVIFDTSSSMASTPPCTREQAANDMDPYDGMCTTECTLADADCARVCPDISCAEYDDTYQALGEIIVDQGSATFFPAANQWDRENDTTAYGGQYRDDEYIPTEIPVLKGAVYQPNLPVDGQYHVFVWWPEDTDLDDDGLGDTFASNALVDVRTSDGFETVSIDQRLDGGQWNLIGSWKMDAGGGTVRIRNEGGNGLVAADAVRWVRYTEPGCVDGDTVNVCRQPICPRGSCFASLNSDDPTSKFYQAKEALYTAMLVSDNTQFGFATYEQDNPRLRAKHWLYRVETADNSGNPFQLPTLDGTDFLFEGDEMVFGNYSLGVEPNPGATLGDGYNCVTGAEDDQRVGCEYEYPADLTDPWEMQRALRIPKGGREGNLSTYAYYRVDHDDGLIYKVVYNPAGVDLNIGDDEITVTVDVYQVVDSSSCGNDICELAAGENCNTCPLDCPGISTGPTSDRFCCGAIDCAGDNPIDCTDLRCTDPDGDGIPDYVCTDVPTVTEIWVETKDVIFSRISDYVAQDGRVERQPMEQGGFFQGEANVASNDTCQGLDPNTDSTNADVSEPEDDDYRGYNLRWTTEEHPRSVDFDQDMIPDDPRLTFFDIGDFVPLDWEDSNQKESLTRLAPNIISGGLTDDPPDFRVARYFADDVDAGDDPTDATLRKLRLNEYIVGADTVIERPIMAIGSTPIGESLADFRHWYAGTDADDEGWTDYAVLGDPLWPCRQTAIVLLTDGIEECYNRQCVDEAGHPFDCTQFDNDPCTVAEELFQTHNVKTYVVGFGIDDGSSLNCIAENGGTGEPLLPQNKDDLIAALDRIFGDIQVSSRAFASASIPAIQSSSADKIFLSSFVCRSRTSRSGLAGSTPSANRCP